jgi:tRNA(Ile)-lysidine synthase
MPRSRSTLTPSASASVAEATSALTQSEFAAALAAIGGFEPRTFVAVAVSGGPDSLALAILADRWARQRGGRAVALTVDHRLRPESADEAATVGGWLAARGLSHAVLVWDGAKPTTGIQAAARAARYRLLAERGAAEGCLHLLTAHHREDQAETYLIRRRAGSAVDGLAGIAAVRELAQLRLVRPLLGVPRARLAALLDAERQPYLRDPSNRNAAFERVRVRERLDPGAVDDAIAEAAANAALRIERERAVAALLARAVSLHPAGFALIDPGPIAAAGELGERALGRVAGTVGGGCYPLRRERLTRLRAALAETPARARTLGGCRFVPWRGRVLVLREIARAAPPVRLDPGASVFWDRRFGVAMPANAAAPLTLSYLGSEGVAAFGRHAVAGDNPLPRLVYPALTALWDGEGLAAVPHLGYRRPQEGLLPDLAFSPQAPLYGAGFTVV